MKKLLIVLIFLLIIFLIQNNFIEKKEKPKETQKVNINVNNDIESLDIENYIVGVLACEMPASFHIEALKANAVASRTYALYKINENSNYILETNTSDQCYYSEDEMKEKWGDKYEEYYRKIQDAVRQTKGQYLTYKGKIIEAFYFSTSNGYTEDAISVFKQDLDYLKSVESSWDIDTKNFLSEVSYREEELINLLGLNENKISNINIVDKSSSGRINKIEINNQVFEGTDIRKKLNLKSTDFEIEKINDVYNFKVKGYGHGVGMSQYGANGMAKEGKTYKDILMYYYTDVKLNNV